MPKEKHDLESALAGALRQLGNLSLDGGLLAQVWMPGELEQAEPDQFGMTLYTKGLPYSLVGPGDMLAIFRCLSCKYSFSADLNKQDAMGSPGRVFVSGEAETSDIKGKGLPESIYLRARDAEACRVSATLLLPIFISPYQEKPTAVLEVTQFNSSGIEHSAVVQWAKRALESVSLYTPVQTQTKAFEMQSHALSIRFFSSRNSAVGCFFGIKNSDSLRQSMQLPGDMLTPQTLQEQEAARVRSQPGRGHSGSGDVVGGVHESPSGARAVQNDTSSSKASLTKEDLEKHFEFGLKEAAQRLGVCNTTLKRTCRRYGIMKWPRRDLLKAVKGRGMSGRDVQMPEQEIAGTTALPVENTTFDSAATSIQPVMSVGQPGFSFAGRQAPLLQAQPPLLSEPSCIMPTEIKPPHPANFLDRSGSSSLETQKTSQGAEGVALQSDQFEMLPPGSSGLTANLQYLHGENSSDLGQGSMRMDLTNQTRTRSLKFFDAMNLLESPRSDIHDFNALLGSSNFDWEQNFDQQDDKQEPQL